jgi:hypothetical protein
MLDQNSKNLHSPVSIRNGQWTRVNNSTLMSLVTAPPKTDDGANQGGVGFGPQILNNHVRYDVTNGMPNKTQMSFSLSSSGIVISVVMYTIRRDTLIIWVFKGLCAVGMFWTKENASGLFRSDKLPFAVFWTVTTRAGLRQRATSRP